MATGYQCPHHPDKVYDQWIKFTGHWGHSHKGEPRPEKEDVEVELLDDFMDDGSEPFSEESPAPSRAGAPRAAPPASPTHQNGAQGYVSPFGQDIPRLSEDIIPSDDTARLAMVLDMHQVDKPARDMVLTIFQMYPDVYQNNPVNLQQLLLTKLRKIYHPSVLMMVTEYGAGTQPTYPGGGMLLPGQGPGMYQGIYPGMNPGMPQGYPQQFPGVGMGYGGGLPMRVPPQNPQMTQSTQPKDPIDDMVRMMSGMGAMMTAMQQMNGGGQQQANQIAQQMQQNFEGLKNTLDTVIRQTQVDKESMRNDFQQRLETVSAQSGEMLEAMKDALHETQLQNKEAEIARLRDLKEQEMSDGLGSLLREAGEGVGAQMEGVRQSLNMGLNKIGDLVHDAITAPGRAINPGSGQPRQKVDIGRPLTPGQAARVVQSENEIRRLITEMGGGGEGAGYPFERPGVEIHPLANSSGARLMGGASTIPSPDDNLLSVEG